VSSPGLDRPLFRPEDYERFRGKRAKVKLSAKVGERRRFEGVLAGVVAGRLLLEADAERYELPLELVESARLIPEL
jgi:ribosome maturation factor RimP